MDKDTQILRSITEVQTINAKLREENARLKDDLHIKTAEWTAMMEENARLKVRLELDGLAQDLCDRVDDAMKGMRLSGESLDECAERLIRERDEARAEVQRELCQCGGPNVCSCNPDTCSCSRCWPSDQDEWRETARSEMAGRRGAEAEVSRLEGLILDWAETSPYVTTAASMLEAEARRIRAQREEGK